VKVTLRPVTGKEPEMPAPPTVIDADTARRLVRALVGVPNGVQAMSHAVADLVESSTNLASVKMEVARGTDGHANPEGGGVGRIVVTTSQRSSVESSKHAVAASVEAVFALAGGRVEHSEGYPGWAPNPASHLLDVTKKSYEKLFGKPIGVRAIHAGLECGLFLEKLPHLEMISTGPTILGAHSPDERLEIATVDRAWRLLTEILETL
jgi:dipeptidase D